MVTFKRAAYDRVSKYGMPHTVRAHAVNRDHWDRRPTNWEATLLRLKGGNTVSDSFTVPNASCPVCGKNVFFYSNAYGVECSLMN